MTQRLAGLKKAYATDEKEQTAQALVSNGGNGPQTLSSTGLKHSTLLSRTSLRGTLTSEPLGLEETGVLRGNEIWSPVQ